MASITAASLTLRSTKGSPLTNAEVDANFTALNTAIATGQTAASYTAADVLAKLITVDGSGSGLDADLLDGLNSATANTASTIVARDASGNFSAGTITANLTGVASQAAALTTTLGIANGGSGATTAAAARTNLGLAIGSDVQAYDAELAALASVTSAADTAPYFTGAGTASTHSFTAYGRSLVGAAAAANARSTLGLVLGTDVQPYDGDLSAIGAIADASVGMYVKSAANTAVVRTIAAGAGISVSNGDGVSGNPTIAANVTSVQGNTGAVIVSVPVTSVQGQTGAVIVTNIGGNAGSASSGWPGSLSQFSNNLGNYGAWVPHNTKSSHRGNCGTFGRHAGSQGNCGNIQAGQNFLLHLDTGSGIDPHYHNQNCHNCNCNC